MRAIRNNLAKIITSFTKIMYFFIKLSNLFFQNTWKCHFEFTIIACKRLSLNPTIFYRLKQLYELLNKGKLTESGFYDIYNKYLKNLCKCNVGNMVEIFFDMDTISVQTE